MAVYIADRRLWLTVDGQVVEDGDPKAHSLLTSGPGKKIPEALAVSLGLMPPSSGGWVADRKLFLTADETRVVEETDPEAATLWITPGKVVPRDQALKLGLMAEEPTADIPDEVGVAEAVGTELETETEDDGEPEPEPEPELQETSPPPASRRRREVAPDGQ